MKSFTQFINTLTLRLTLVLAGASTFAARPTTSHIASDFDRDGKADIAFRNKATGETQIWYMNGTDLKSGKDPKSVLYSDGSVVYNPAPAGSNPDLHWRIVGTGLVNGDTIPDIIWQNMSDGHLAVWYMGDPAGTTDGNVFVAAYEYLLAPSPGFRLVGVGYFNDDAVLDVVWENVSSPSYVAGQLAIWYMSYTEGTKAWNIASGLTPSPTVPTSIGWQAMTVGDFGRSHMPFPDGTPNPNGDPAADGVRDGQPDLLLRNVQTHTTAIWIYGGANGAELRTGSVIYDPGWNPWRELVLNPIEYRVAKADDYGGVSGSTTFTDMMLRIDDFGETAVYFLEGKLFRGGAYFGPSTSPKWPIGNPALPNFSPHPAWRRLFDHQWKVPAQDLAELTGRTQSVPAIPLNELVATELTTGYRLTWNLPIFDFFPGTYKIYYKKSEDHAWIWIRDLPASQTISTEDVTSLPGNQPFEPNQRYDFNVTLVNSQNSTFKGSAAQTSVAKVGRPLDDRGAVLILVDQDLKANFPLQMDEIVSDLTESLVGDGWRVLYPKPVARHQDDYTAYGFHTKNFDKLDAIKDEVRDAELQGANTVIIIGHVVIPFSGYLNPDGHGSRSGPADLFYVDLNGEWEDEGTPHAPPDPLFPSDSSKFKQDVPVDERQYLGNDGKMNQSYVPATESGAYDGIEMAIGRVDFARMALFGTGDSPSTLLQMQKEVEMIGDYFAKTRKYRFNQYPYPLPARAIVWNEPKGQSPDAQVSIARSILGTSPGLVVSGDGLMQRTVPYLFGATAGSEVAGGYRTGSPSGEILLWHKDIDPLSPGIVSKIGFNLIHCSYHWDWNLADRTAMKSLITPADYGLATLYNKGAFEAEVLALGDTLGSALVHTIQAEQMRHTFYTFSDFLAPARSAVHNTIVGDPTLRLHYLYPPRSPSKTGSSIQWQLPLPEPPNPADAAISSYSYLVYFLNSGEYQRVTSTTVPVGCCSTPLSPQETSATSFMIRSVHTVTTGSGSYQALSQGVFYHVQ